LNLKDQKACSSERAFLFWEEGTPHICREVPPFLCRLQLLFFRFPGIDQVGTAGRLLCSLPAEVHYGTEDLRRRLALFSS
jgi:hypothetical protein